MNSAPFLSQFKVKRIEDQNIESAKMIYDQNLDYNKFSKQNDRSVLSISTTSVKGEQPNHINANCGTIEYSLLTNTYTDVKGEQPDQPEGLLSSNNSQDMEIFNDNVLILSDTGTRNKSEQPDQIDELLRDDQTKEIYLQSKTLTEVKSEQADALPDSFLYELLMTQTFTKTRGEASDPGSFQ